MNSATLNQLIVEGLRLNDPDYFRIKCHPAKRSPRDLTLDVLDQVVNETSKALPNAPTVTLLFKVRGVLAPMAQKLRWAMDSLLERNAGSLPGNQTRKAAVGEMVMHQLDYVFGGDVPPVLQDLVAKVVAQEAAGAVELGGVTRASLAMVSLFLQRASACIWTLAMHTARASADATPGTSAMGTVRSTKKPASSAATSAYIKVLKEFAKKIASLNIDPTKLPVGETAVAEADALCAVRYFVESRFRELRRWVHPQAAVELHEVPHAEVSADLGEQLILHYHNDRECADANDPQAWTWRGRETEEYIIGDMLCALQHAAEALGIDWDDAQGAGEWHHDNDLKGDKLAET